MIHLTRRLLGSLLDLGWGTLIFMVLVCGCGRKQPEHKTEPAAPATSDSPAVTFPRQVQVAGKSLDLPDDPEALLDFLNKMADSPPGASVEEQTSQLKEMLRARELAAEKLLHIATPAASDYKLIASRAKIESLQLLAGLGELSAADKLLKYARDLALHPDRSLARSGTLGVFVAESLAASHAKNRAVTDPSSPENENPPVIARLTDLLESQTEKDLDLFGATTLVARDLLEHGQPLAGAIALMRIGQAFCENHDANLVRMAEESISQGAIAFFQDLQGQVLDALPPEKIVASLNEYSDLIGNAWGNLQVGQDALNFATSFEQTFGLDLARPIWKELKERWGDREPSQDTAKQLMVRVVQAEKRASLIGQSIVVAGKQLDEADFTGDFPPSRESDVKRIVLFWSSQSELALAEVQNLKAILQGRDRGKFDIVLVNLDQDLSAARSALEKLDVDWPVLIGIDQGKAEGTVSIGEVCGVDYVPLILVINAEKKITHVCSSILQLEEILR